jgi:pyrroline-5-carboxylate reductase
MLDDRSIGFIGAGFMAEALVNGLLKSGATRPEKITVSDIRPDRLDYLSGKYSVKTEKGNLAVASGSDLVVIAVKPQDVPTVLDEIGGTIPETGMILSIAAGVRIGTIAEYFPGKVVRAMPNTCAQVGEAITALAFDRHAQEGDRATAVAFFGSVGETVVVDEKMMDAVTGISGSGPAYIYLVIESLINAGVEAGLKLEVSRQLVYQTVKGAAIMAIETGEHPATLRERITSPQGTTAAALHQLEEKGVRGIFMDAVAAAVKRSKELG